MLTIRSSIAYRADAGQPADRDAVLLPVAGSSNWQRLSDRLQSWGLDKAAADAAVQRLTKQEFKAKPGDVSIITDLAGQRSFVIFGVSADPDQRFATHGARQASVALDGMRQLVEALKKDKPARLALDVAAAELWQRPDSLYAGKPASLLAAHVVQAIELAYTPLPKQVKEPKPEPTPAELLVVAGAADVAAVGAAVERERILAAAANLVRILTVFPANSLTLDRYTDLLTEIAADDPQLSLHQWHSEALAAAGAGAIVAVGRAAVQSPRIISLCYNPAQTGAHTVAVVGKGVVFDTGGLSLKPSKFMLGMHDDMSGSAVAAATAWAAAKLKLPYAVHAYLGLAENAIGPDAYRPGDILTAMNGKTIEVVDTDAEGRLVLADTLVMAQRESKPELMLDFATLTGSCVRALGEIASGVFGNREELFPVAVQVGYETGERVWAFPNWPDYTEALESKVADIRQCSPEAGPDMLHATNFLSEFVAPELPWLHVDMASVRNDDGLGAAPGGYTGFGPRFGLALIDRIVAK
jgi:leucyl aminopeptidase